MRNRVMLPSQLCAVLLMMSLDVAAQQAPHVCGAGPGPHETMAGVQPAGPGMAPTPLCYWKSGGGMEQGAPSIRWADRWGAIAGDGKGLYGIAMDMPRQRDAERNAIADCRTRGGKSCEVRLAFYNSCAVIGASTSHSFSSSAPTVGEAEESAMQRCEAASGKGTCWVYYSGCSLPVQVQ